MAPANWHPQQLILLGLGGHPHGNASVCKRTCFASFWPIVHMDPVNALFWNLVSGWKNPKTLPWRSCVDSESAYFVYQWHHRPKPSTSSLQTATSHNNNNGRLHACVHAAEDTEPIRVTRAKYYAPLPLRWAKGLLTSSSSCCVSVWFLLLLSVCIKCASFMRMLRHFFSAFVFNGSVWTQIFLNRCQKKTRENDCFGTCGHGLSGK